MADVSVIGLGRLGLPLATLLSAKGFGVVGVDVDQRTVDAVNARRVPERIFELGLQEMLGKAETLIATTETAAAACAPISIVLLPTPSAEDGSFSLGPILGACRSLGAALRERSDYHVVVVSSTVSPGSCDGPIAEMLEETSGRKLGTNLGLCYCPEMVALGDVIQGFLWPDFVAIGESDFDAGRIAAALHLRLCDRPRIYHMSLIDAELMKMALNCYIALKITFANELAELCEKFPNADVDAVTHVLGLDSRISGKYLEGATAYGGLCFPRDTGALAHAAESAGTRSLLMNAVTAANRWQVRRLVLLIKNCVRQFDVKTVGVLGLAFKPGTNITQGSIGETLLPLPGLPGLAENVIAFDPIVRVEQSAGTAQACVDKADLVVVTSPCKEFKPLVFRSGQTVIDCWRIYSRECLETKGVNYIGIGLGPK